MVTRWLSYKRAGVTAVYRRRCNLEHCLHPGLRPNNGRGFRDLKWGATHGQVSLAFPSASCDTRQSEISDWTCVRRGEKVNDVSVMMILKGYPTGKVE